MNPRIVGVSESSDTHPLSLSKSQNRERDICSSQTCAFAVESDRASPLVGVLRQLRQLEDARQ